MFSDLIRFIREQYRTEDVVPLHAPRFAGREREYVGEAIDSTMVSSVGPFVDRFEKRLQVETGVPRAIGTASGTAALHVALLAVGVEPGDLVITQALTFIATCNAIRYCGADPVLVDVDRSTLGLSPAAVHAWLGDHATLDDRGVCRARASGRRIRAVVPMHTFGHPVDLHGLVVICNRWNLMLVEDAAESLGSFYDGRHTGGFGAAAALSFNGNKILTCGGGGAVLASGAIAERARHLSTTAKRSHAYEFLHDEIGFNYRLPGLNAALGLAQLEQLATFLGAKRRLAERYAEHLSGGPLTFVAEPANARSNYWLNAVLCENRAQRDALLAATNGAGVSTRPVWEPMHRLPMYGACLRDDLAMTEWLSDRLVNLPSSVPGIDSTAASRVALQDALHV